MRVHSLRVHLRDGQLDPAAAAVVLLRRDERVAHRQHAKRVAAIARQLHHRALRPEDVVGALERRVAIIRSRSKSSFKDVSRQLARLAWVKGLDPEGAAVLEICGVSTHGAQRTRQERSRR